MGNFTGNVYNNIWNGDDTDEYANGAEGYDTLNGGGGNDTILGGTQNDVVDGGSGNDVLYGDIENPNSGEGGYDTIYGGSGDDTIYAGIGWDIIYPGTGNDSIDGNDAWTQQDTLMYDSSTADLLVTITAEGTGTVIEGAETDVFTRVERLVLGSGNDSVTGSTGRDYADGRGGTDTLVGGGGDDTFLGGDGDDLIYGDAGNDQLTGGIGNDTLYGGTNGDTLTGGTGSDYLDGGSDTNAGNTLSFADLPAGVSVTFSAVGSGTAISGSDTDTFVGFTFGSYGLTSHNDTLTGSSGNDGVFDGAGNDSISLLGGNDQIISGRGSDTIDGGDGLDLYYAEDIQTNPPARVVMGAPTGPDASETDYLVNIERVTLTRFADTFIGGEGSHRANLGTGNDIAYASAGNDTIDGGADLSFGLPNYLDVDTIDYSGLGVSVTYNAATGTVTKAGLGTDSITGFEAFIFGDAGSAATGGSGKDNFVGGSGTDSLLGGAGNDTLSGLDGNDTLEGGADHDVVDGGIGNDWIMGGDGNDAIQGDADNDTLSGNAGNDTVYGGGGNDVLGGGTGNDQVFGEDGDDLIYGGIGNQTIDGASGNDTLTYRSQTTPFLVTLSAPGNGTVSSTGIASAFAGIEAIILGQGNDTFIGGEGDDIVTGSKGNDSLSGGAGNDRFLIAAWDGNDTIDGGDGFDTIVLTGIGAALTWPGISSIETIDSSGAADARIMGDAAANLIDLSAFALPNVTLIDGSHGNDTITGTNSGDTISGGRGNDSLSGGTGNDVFLIAAGDGSDTIDGGDGFDTIVVSGANAAIFWLAISNIELVDASAASAARVTGGNSADLIDFSATTLLGITIIDGGGGNDTILGSAGDDTLQGGGGVDSLSGGDGADTFFIGVDITDTIDGGQGTDTLLALMDNAMIDWTLLSSIEAVDADGFANVRIRGAAGNDLIDLSDALLTGIALVDGSAGDDTIIGSDADDRLFGSSGADLLTGGAGNDAFVYTLVGQSRAAGTDTISDFAPGDLIDLAGIDANTGMAENQAFTLIGDAAFSRTAGELRHVIDTASGRTIIDGDVNGDGRADLTIVLTGELTLSASDFLL